MPDVPMKNTFFFAAEGKSVPVGWTETWWSFHASLDAAETAARTYVTVRKQLLGLGARVTAWRGTFNPAAFPAQNVKRISQVYFFQGNEGIGSTYTIEATDAFDPAHEDLLCRAESLFQAGPPPVGSRRSVFLSGMPDRLTDQLKAQGVDAAFLGADFKQWVKRLKEIPYYIRKKITNGPPPTYNGYAIESVQPIMIRHRNRGRPFFLFRGRRLA
jgi:hypothetical protein